MALVRPKGAAAAPPPGGVPPRLDAPDPAVRRDAAHALATDPLAAPELCAHLPGEADASVREAVLTALARIASSDAAAGLAALLAGEDVALRNGALESLHQMPPEVVAPVVEPLLRSADSDVRIFAAHLVGRVGNPRRVDALLPVLEHDPHVNVCLAAAEALAETGDPRLLPGLERLARRFPDDPFVAFACGAARARFPTT